MKRLVPTQLVAVLFAAFTLLLNPQASANYTWSTLAGPICGPGADDGVAAAALFSSPSSTAVDDEGTVYVADTDNHTIRMITPTGVVSTLAGSPGQSGSADGTGSNARFNSPRGIAVQGMTIYVADTGNHTIRKISVAGVVTTFAGAAGASGSTDNASGALARFNGPRGVTVDASSTVYVADTGNHTIRRITAAGAVTTLAGSAGNAGAVNDANGANARFNAPEGIAADASTTIYVADTGNHTIRRITTAGSVTTLAGSAGMAGSADGTGAAARFNSPRGVDVDDAGNVIVGDTGNHTIRRITTGGSVTTLAGLAGAAGSTDGTGNAARFNGPRGVAAFDDGTIIVADTANHTIRMITPVGVVSTYAGSPERTGAPDGATIAARFNYPRGIAMDSAGTVYLADTGNHTIRKITPAGVVTTFAGSAGNAGSTNDTGGLARFNSPRGVAVDTAGNVYVADTGNHTIRKITPAGSVSTLAGFAGAASSTDGTGNAARFNSPRGVAVDTAGNVYVADTGNHTIRMITPAGVVSTIAGFAGAANGADGTGNAARFNTPSGLAVAVNGDIYVADTGNHSIRQISPARVVSTHAGLSGTPGNTDGLGTSARFRTPEGVAVDGFNDVYVSDTGNHTIRKIAISNRGVSTIGGLAGVYGQAPGVGSNARFNGPVGVTVPANASLVYVCDRHRVVRGLPPTSGLNVSTTSMSGFTALRGSDSPAQTFTVSATGLTGPVTVTAPSGFQISALGSSFVPNLTLAKSSSNTLATTTVSVILLRSMELGSKSGTLVVATPGSSNKPITLSGVVIEPQPTLTVSASALNGFVAPPNKASIEKTFTVSGIGLGADITVTAPAGFLVSALGRPFASSLTLTKSSQNILTTTTISVVMAASTELGAKAGSITVVSTGAESKSVQLSGSVGGLSASVSSLTAFVATRTSPSSSQSLIVSGAGLTSDVKVSAPAGFEVATGGGTFRSSVTIFRQSDGTIAATTLDVRLRPSRSRGSKSGQMLITSSGAPTVIVSCSGRVE